MPPDEKPVPHLLINTDVSDIHIDCQRRVRIQDPEGRSIREVRYLNLTALNDHGNTWDEVYLHPAPPNFALRMRKGNTWYNFDQEIGNEECGVFTRYEIGPSHDPISNKEYLTQDGTWKPYDKGYDFPADAVRIKIFAPKPPFP